MVPISDGPVGQPVSAKWIQLIPVPSSQHVAVAQNEPFEQRSMAVNQAHSNADFKRLVIVSVVIMRGRGMTCVRNAGIESSGGRAQVIACIQLLNGGVGILPTLVVAQSIYHGVNRLRSRGRKLGF